jgi:hypothetical protein
MSLHPALADPDILRAIFGHVGSSCDSEGAGIGAQQQLARAARCCKAFSEHALDTLWKRMDDLIPLFKILPAFQEIDGAFVSPPQNSEM